jgi:hypothetical protein
VGETICARSSVRSFAAVNPRSLETSLAVNVGAERSGRDAPPPRAEGDVDDVREPLLRPLAPPLRGWILPFGALRHRDRDPLKIKRFVHVKRKP